MWFPSAPSTKGGPQPRVSSPDPARSTLITSAPRSASTCPAQGPARIRASSRTRKPVNGFVILRSYLRCGAFTRLSKFARLCGLGREFCLELTSATNIGPSHSAHTKKAKITREDFMSLSRRRVLMGALAAPAVIAHARLGSAAPPKVLKISHQFPGGTIDQGDFRDRLCRKFAADLEAKTNGALGAQVYPNSSLMKTVAQFSAVRKGALDMSLYPISYAGGEYAELNIGLMPGLVSSYAQGADRQSAGCQGIEGPRRQPRDGHGTAGCWRHHADDAVERALCRHANRRLRCSHHVLHQPDLVPPRRGGQEPYHRTRQ